MQYDLTRVAYRFGMLVGIRWYFPGIYHTDTKRKLGWYFGIVNLAGTPFSPKRRALAPFFDACRVGWSYSVQYKGIFGSPGQGQMLYVWRGQTVESGLRCSIKSSLGYEVAGPPHHHHIITAFLRMCSVLDRPTRQDPCASLWRSGQDTHAFGLDKNQF